MGKTAQLWAGRISRIGRVGFWPFVTKYFNLADLLWPGDLSRLLFGNVPEQFGARPILTF